jgi:hypothetical protein
MRINVFNKFYSNVMFGWTHLYNYGEITRKLALFYYNGPPNFDIRVNFKMDDGNWSKNMIH